MKHPSRFHASLEEALAAGGPKLPQTAMRHLEEHWRLVKSWNARTNLTAVTDDVEAAWRHYRDSLEALALLQAGPLLDIGSGAGFPGIPLAIARPGWPVTLMEPRRKRASLLRAAAARLSLANISVVERRVQDAPEARFAAAVTRATFSSPDDLRSCLAWLAPGGRLLSFRAQPTTAPESSVLIHRYSLRSIPRAIEVWIPNPDSHK